MPSHAGERKGLHAATSHRSPRRRLRWLFALVFLATPGVVIVRVVISGHPAGSAVHFLLILAVVLVLSFGQGYAVYVSSKRTCPRPRQQYFLFSLCYLILAIISASVGGAADAHHISWLSNIMVWPMGLCFAGLLVMFGRGAFRGRVRRAFWRIPPPWLDHDLPAATSTAVNTDAQEPASGGHGSASVIKPEGADRDGRPSDET